MTRKQRRKVVIIGILLVLLLLLLAYFAFFRATRQLSFDIATPTGEVIPVPQYLFSFAGDDAEPFVRPIGVFVDGDTVYVADSRARKVFITNLDGEVQGELDDENVIIPLYMAKNPTTGNIWVSDRRTRTINIFNVDGDYLGEFEPNLPEDQLPAFDTGDVVWAPVALDFAPDGTLYVTELLRGHRMLIFNPEGEFVRSVGTAGAVALANEAPEFFQFPNSVKVHGEEVWVADSNNRRIQVFDLEGNYDRIIVTDGLPRGLEFLNSFRSDEGTGTNRFVVVDTLAHDGTIWSADSGQRIVNFGQQGVLEGQFSFPNDVSVSDGNRIFITDAANARVQVWGWPQEAIPEPIAEALPYWRWCFSPLLLLPLLLLMRKKRFFATEDFVQQMLTIEMAEQMPKRRRKWQVTEPDYELLKDYTQGEVDMADLLNPTEFSESDVKDLMEKLEIDREPAILLSLAKRSHVFCTEDEDMRRLARTLEIDVVDHEEFLERYASKDDDSDETSGTSQTSAQS